MSEKVEEGPVVSTEGLVDPDGRNVTRVKCSNEKCSSKILPAQMATFEEVAFKLHVFKARSDPDKAEYQSFKQFWMVQDMFDFDNVGFSNTVDGIKYLVCADCEMGPIGYHDLETKKCYVALARVEHVKD